MIEFTMFRRDRAIELSGYSAVDTATTSTKLTVLVPAGRILE